MFKQICRQFTQLALVTCLSMAMLSACASEDVSEAPIGTVQQRQEEAVCKCTTPESKVIEVTCYDTCFREASSSGQVECGPSTAPCHEVCRFENMDSITGDDCEALDAFGEVYRGQCARAGVTSLNREGCCPACLNKEGICGSLTDPMMCGNLGDECRLCPDDTPNDCKLPRCKEGNCSQDGPNRPNGFKCVDSKGVEGQCVSGSCCTGCRTATQCLAGTGIGACGAKGAQCKDCDDKLACNGLEKCVNGGCQDAPDLNCDDNDPCTKDGCDDDSGCTNEIDVGQTCNDGDGCTTNDQCADDGRCSGTTVTCDDGNPCTTDSCNGGACEFAPVVDSTPCDDGSSCTLVSTCQSGVCTADANDVCHDINNPCVTSSCGSDGMGSCMEMNRPDDTPCDDGDPCTTNDSCQAGQCEGGAALDCNDNNPCTTDACQTGSGCTHANTSGECADGDLCTEGDRCQDGECMGDPVACPATNECTAEGQCDDTTGLCSVLLLEDGTECGEGGACEGGKCDGEDVPPASGGTGGGAGASGEAGAAGADASGGSSSGGTSGSGGGGGDGGGTGGATPSAGGTFSGPTFTRDPQGCECRAAPGQGAPGGGGAALLVLAGAWSVGVRRRKRLRR